MSTALACHVQGDGSPIVLLHGMVSSATYWDDIIPRLAGSHRLFAPDLLGFGRSPKPPEGYTPDHQAAAVIDTLDALGVAEPATVVGHSAGCVVAMRLAMKHPSRVRSIVGFGPPLYSSPAAARAHIGAVGPMARLFTLPGPLAAAACRWVCNHRDLAGRLAVLTHPRFPPAVAADSVAHTWASYTGTLEQLIIEPRPSTWLDSISVPVHLVVGERDPVVDIEHLRRLDGRGAAVSVWPGDHHLPLRRSAACAALVERVAQGRDDPSGRQPTVT